MKKILIGTHNQGKFKEIAYLISKKYKKISPFILKIKSPKETGKTFSTNSKLKARYFSKFVNYPVISDDSGLCISALDGRPGVHSARLAKKKGGFLPAMKFILKKLDKKKNRSAYFVCNLSYRYANGFTVSAEGKVNGRISSKILGKNGFGYDPIFIPNKKKITFGQMIKSKKIKMDHRFIAFKKLKKKIKTL
jgi:XTP/dITP diphosphohydrolase